MIQTGDSTLLPPPADWESLLSDSFVEALDELSQRLGSDTAAWRWGTVHHTRPRHPLSAPLPELSDLLDPPSMPMGGDGDTPQAGSYSPGDQFVMTSMSVARYTFDLADWEGSRWVVPLGSSGHPGSPHYADQAPVWQQVSMLPMTYNWEKLEAQAESHQSALPR
jgi:penicillin amidase